MSNQRDALVPTISRVADDTLIELVYDASKRKTGLIVSRFGGLWNVEQEVRIGTGEMLVPYDATNNLIRNECVLLPSAPREYGAKDELIADVRAYLQRYVDLSPFFAEIATHYILLTWVYDRFGELPYLRLRGDYGTGKTRGLLVIGLLCNKAFFASGASTTAPIFHTLNAFGGTLILDEADFPYSDAKADLVKIFNNGTVPGMPVLRCVPNKSKEYDPAAFKVFGPKLVAMREHFDDEALESRFFTEETGRHPLRADIPISLPPCAKTEALELRNRLLHFRLCEYFKIAVDPGRAIEGIEPRLNQCALALLSLVDSPQLRRELETVLRSRSKNIRISRQRSPEGQLVRAVANAFADSPTTPFIQIRTITDRLNVSRGVAGESPVSYKWVGHMVRSRLHLSTRKSHGLYGIPTHERANVEALARRFGTS